MLNNLRFKFGLIIRIIKTDFILATLYKFSLFRKLDYKFSLIKSYKGYDNLKKFNLDKNSIVLDFGANIGDFAGYIFDNYRCNVYCYEPNPIPFKFMQKRLGSNKKIFLKNVGVDKGNGQKKMYLSKSNMGMNTVYYSTSSSLELRKNLDSNNLINIKVDSIDDILNQYNFIDLIKIDIEGSEYNILDSILSNKYKIKFVVCEFHSKLDAHKQKKEHWVKILKEKNLYEKWLYEWH